MLEVNNLTAGYGAARAISEVAFRVPTAGAVALLGRNGAGKSTTIKSVMGLCDVYDGRITLDGVTLSGQSPDSIARAGVGYVPEDRRVFTDLSVMENLETGQKAGADGAVIWTASKVFDLFPEIARRRDATAGTLSGGERQMLAIARALMGNPCILLLDEPSEGLAPVVVQRLGETLSALALEGLTLLLAEQNKALARRLANNVVILETGHVVFTGTFDDLDRMPELLQRYLGV
tara:strand:+ start:12914 stop:13615 length:702 start_codon:yes stop_codon:yes gene_type:complete